MRAIRRVGAPSILSRVAGEVCRFAVSLDPMPTAAWLNFFRSTEDWSATRHPLFVDVSGKALLFDSREDELPSWLTDLDRWIRTANQACAEMFV